MYEIDTAIAKISRREELEKSITELKLQMSEQQSIASAALAKIETQKMMLQQHEASLDMLLD